MKEAERMTPEMENLKTKLRAVWSAGDYGQIAKSIAGDAAEFIERLNLRPGMRVLDVACGTGNLSLPAARAGAEVTGVDIAANLVEQARERAAAENLKIRFDVGDAEDLPFEDGSFDVVVTMFGAMFAPRPKRTASELKRVCRSGGLIAMANWTPEGFAGQLFRLGGKYAPPPDMPPPVLWGDEETVRERLSEGISDLKLTRRKIMLRYPFAPREVVEHFRTYFGPTKTAFESLDENRQESLRQDMEELWSGNNLATDGTTEVEGEYLEVIARRE